MSSGDTVDCFDIDAIAVVSILEKLVDFWKLSGEIEEEAEGHG